MTIREALQQGFQQFSSAGLDTPMLDAVVLLAHACGIPKEKLFSSYPDTLGDSFQAAFDGYIAMRLSGTPVSYIRKRKEFFGLEFYVDERVLVPRPDTETLVEESLETIRKNGEIRTVLDLCTGSGCIAITIKHSIPELYVAAADISKEALQVFTLNARNIVKNELPHFRSDLFNNVPGTYDLIVSNPPYLTRDEVDTMKKRNWPEPALALAGGAEGGEILQRIITESGAHLNPGGFLLLEGGPDQLEEMKKVMEKSGYLNILIRQDLAGRNRVLRGRKNGF